MESNIDIKKDIKLLKIKLEEIYDNYDLWDNDVIEWYKQRDSIEDEISSLESVLKG